MSTKTDLAGGAPVELFGRTYTWNYGNGRWALVAEPAEVRAARGDLVDALYDRLAAASEPPARWVPWWTARQLDWLRRHLVLPRLRAITRRGVRRGTGEL